MNGWEEETEDLFSRVRRLAKEDEVNRDEFFEGEYSSGEEEEVVERIGRRRRNGKKSKKQQNGFLSRNGPHLYSPTKIVDLKKRKKTNKKRPKKINSMTDISRIYSSGIPTKKPYRPQSATNSNGKKNRSSFSKSLKRKKKKEKIMKRFLQRIEFLEKKLKDKDFEHRKEIRNVRKEKKHKISIIQEIQKDNQGLKEEVSNLKQKIYKKTRQMNLFFKSNKLSSSFQRQQQQPKSNLSSPLPKIQKRKTTTTTTKKEESISIPPNDNNNNITKKKKKKKKNNNNNNLSSSYLSEIETTKLQQLRNIIEFQKREKKKLYNSLQRTQKKQSTQKLIITQLNKKYSILKQKSNTLTFNNSKLSQKLSIQETKIQELLNRIGELENEVSEHKYYGRDCGRRNDELQKSLSKATRRINCLEEDRIRLSQENESLRFSFSSSSSTINSLE